MLPKCPDAGLCCSLFQRDGVIGRGGRFNNDLDEAGLSGPFRPAGEDLGGAFATTQALLDRGDSVASCQALLHMSMGLPIICSPVGMNWELVQPGINGLLAGSLDDVVLRRQNGTHGRRHIIEHFSVATAVEQMGDVFEHVARAA